MSAWIFFVAVPLGLAGAYLHRVATSRRMANLRAELAGAPTLFDESGLQTMLYVTHELTRTSLGVADVLVTQHCVRVLFQQERSAAPAPMRLTRTREERDARDNWGVVDAFVNAPPRADGTKVTVQAQDRWFGYEIDLHSARPEELLRALERFLLPPGGSGPFRAREPGEGAGRA